MQNMNHGVAWYFSRTQNKGKGGTCHTKFALDPEGFDPQNLCLKEQHTSLYHQVPLQKPVFRFLINIWYIK
jgi:hypothetical protein